MNHDALESQMEALATEAQPNTPPKRSTHQQPIALAPAISKRWIVTLMLTAALFGAMITGLICLTSSPPPSALMQAVGTKQGEPTIDVFFLGIGRYRN
ncbi:MULTISPECIES: hypothetical protein [Desulfoluna]|uniref:Uncharacterized protein n=1 Tax=Desulfoluna butyratoxydans TaxID=231438 RepID=A0A4U8YGX1_9BACT|nr:MULTISPECIES: hypothetical protein [Desulfoluna]VFQ42417.1 hypothetical protein MSL71_350 [Desulfoluna butyratoxydans]VVS90758.1 consensus disorder prediction [Desulfoluna spongiiphila]